MRTFTTSASRRAGLLGVPVVAMAAGATLAACGGGSTALSAKSAPARSAGAPATTPAPATTAAPVDDVAIQIQTGDQDGNKDDWPRFYPADITVHHGDTVRLTITNYDDGPAPLTSALVSYDTVQGGSETVNGTTTQAVDNNTISHTWTVPALGLNAAVPAVTSGSKTNTVVFTFTAGAPGTYDIKCFAPCGDDPDGMGGAMATPDWMKGTLTIT